MRLNEDDAWDRVRSARHGILGTVHPERGVDLVPVAYAVDDDTIFVPVDTVKAKTTTRLQRIENLASDPRCTLLADHYDEDWDRLWWVRVNGEGAEATDADLARFRPLLAHRYPQYANPDSIVGGIVIRPRSITGWAAG